MDKESARGRSALGGKKEKIMKKIPKPWGQKEHDQFMKESEMTEEEHEAWHKEHGGMHGKNKDKEG
jgi:hypothetical protein